ncbi:hypothetical protein [Microcoleus sp. Pol12B5]|uniref:hypothetical protein n=1 Tax=Microcoleus sp. Pol12B5 TaxID=3055396 RepID=UPI002FD4845E
MSITPVYLSNKTPNYTAYVGLPKIVSLNLPKGGIYDGLIAQAALKASVDVLLTLNPKDFTRVGEDVRRCKCRVKPIALCF